MLSTDSLWNIKYSLTRNGSCDISLLNVVIVRKIKCVRLTVHWRSTKQEEMTKLMIEIQFIKILFLV